MTVSIAPPYLRPPQHQAPGTANGSDIRDSHDSSDASFILTHDSLTLIELLAFSYLHCQRPGSAANLFALLASNAECNDRLLGALALAQLRSNLAEAALATLARASVASQLDAPFQLLRAQALQHLQRREEAAVAMRAFVTSRMAKLLTPNIPVTAEGHISTGTSAINPILLATDNVF